MRLLLCILINAVAMLSIYCSGAPMDREGSADPPDRFQFGEWSETPSDPDVTVGQIFRAVRKTPSYARGPPKSIIMAESSSTKAKGGLFSKFRGKASTSRDVNNAHHESALALTAAEANRVKDTFNITDADLGSSKVTQWQQIRPTFQIESVIEKVIPFIMNDYHDAYFAKMIVEKCGNYKTHLALLSNDEEDQKAAVQYMILEYEADTASH